MALDIGTLGAKVDKYKSILKNTTDYRKAWGDGLKKMIVDTLQEIIDQTKLDATIETDDRMGNLETIQVDLGRTGSGMYEKLDKEARREVIKINGVLTYQQLFNGKVVAWMGYPNIEGMSEPRPPKTIEILRPEEFNQGFIMRHFEEFIKEITEWEDFDDDHQKSAAIGFNAVMPPPPPPEE